VCQLGNFGCNKSDDHSGFLELELMGAVDSGRSLVGVEQNFAVHRGHNKNYYIVVAAGGLVEEEAQSWMDGVHRIMMILLGLAADSE